MKFPFAAVLILLLAVNDDDSTTTRAFTATITSTSTFSSRRIIHATSTSSSLLYNDQGGWGSYSDSLNNNSDYKSSYSNNQELDDGQVLFNQRQEKQPVSQSPPPPGPADYFNQHVLGQTNNNSNIPQQQQQQVSFPAQQQPMNGPPRQQFENQYQSPTQQQGYPQQQQPNFQDFLTAQPRAMQQQFQSQQQTFSQPPPRQSNLQDILPSTFDAQNPYGPTQQQQQQALVNPQQMQSQQNPPMASQYPQINNPSAPGSQNLDPLMRAQSNSVLFDNRGFQRQQVEGSGAGPKRITLQGGNTLRTWSFSNPNMSRVQVNLYTDGRPLDADVELWQGPGYTPLQMKVYVEDGYTRPFNAVIQSRRAPNTISIRNIGPEAFPLEATVQSDLAGYVPDNAPQLVAFSKGHNVQGGAVETFAFDASVESIQVLLTTDMRPLNARIELLQGPNNIKQSIDFCSEDGMAFPLHVILPAPGYGNVVRVVNTATMEYPLTCHAEPYSFASHNGSYYDDVIIQ